MRDHLLGFPAIAEKTAEVELEAANGYSFGNWWNDYPLGVPKRAQEEADRTLNAIYPERAPALTAFECLNHPNPDGTCDPVRKPATSGWATSNLGLNQLLRDTLKKNADRIKENVITGNKLFLKGISCKPAPGEVLTAQGIYAVVQDAMAQGTEAHSALLDEPASPLQTYMAGYLHARKEEAATMNQHAAEKRAAFNAERARRISHNEQARKMGEANAVGVACSSYEVAFIKAPPEGVIQKSDYTYTEHPCGFAG